MKVKSIQRISNDVFRVRWVDENGTLNEDTVSLQGLKLYLETAPTNMRRWAQAIRDAIEEKYFKKPREVKHADQIDQSEKTS